MAQNYVSLFRLIEDVYRSEGYTQEVDLGDLVDWAGEAIGLIGAPKLYDESVTGNSLITPDISIVDYRGSLPVNFVSILPGGVRDADTKEVYDAATDSFRTRPANVVEDLHHQTGRKTYIIKNNFIEVSEKTATLQLAYKSFKIDDNGFPMIPENERVQKAIKAFMTFKVDHRLWRQNKLSESVYRDSEREWLWYVGSAGTAMRILTPDEREVWTRQWTRLLPIINSHQSSFAHIGTRENLNLGSNND